MRISITYLLCFFTIIVNSVESNLSVLENKIVGGNIVRLNNKNTINYIASLQLNGRHFCSGGLISRLHVLTAGHCLLPVITIKHYLDVLTVVGTFNTRQNGTAYDIKHIDIHQNYYHDPNGSINDIGLVTHYKKITLSSTVGVLNLPNFDPRPGTEAVISGWGSIQNFLKDFQTPMELDVLKYLLITVMDYKNCQEAYSPRLIYPGQFCAKSSKVKENASEGDSGGPLVSKNIIFGILSSGETLNLSRPCIYTNVYLYLRYIDEAKERAKSIKRTRKKNCD